MTENAKSEIVDISIDAVKDNEGRFSELWSRQDDDLLLYYLDEYTLKDSNDKEIKDADSITLNDPMTYADRVVSSLSSANWNFNVYGIDAAIQKQLEEKFNEAFELNDEILGLADSEPLSTSIDFVNCLRGWQAIRVLMFNDGDKWQPEFMPLDPRWVSYASDKKGLIYASYVIRMTAEMAASQFGYEGTTGTDVDVRSVWTREKYYNYIDDQLVGKVEDHKFGIVPIYIAPVPTQAVLIGAAGEDILVRRGESIYAANRSLYTKLNEQISVWATMNKMQFMSPLAFISPHGRKMDKKPYGIGVVVSLREGEQLVPIPTQKLSDSAQTLIGQLVARIQRGSLPNVDYGELSFELSALAIAKLTENRDQVFRPRLIAKARAYRRICEMMRTEVLAGGFPIDIDDTEFEVMTFDPDIMNGLKQNWRLKAEFFSISPEQNIANYTIDAQARQSGVSKLTRFRDILKLKDPEGEIRQADVDQAHVDIPKLRMFDYAISIAPAGSGLKLMEEEIQTTRAQIVLGELKGMLSNNDMAIQGIEKLMGGLPQVASQAAPDTRMPAQQMQKLVSAESQKSGIQPNQQGTQQKQIEA